ncbi:hypothetical protein F5X68DRAFT_273725 [Plectosphaerella plurivora]|uniref:Zn(2)-C6 fungal-type domain-containing protein n=1 Tax=Plectosphaerella plurivora TaxID=936078 RepID=A0A9P9AFX8_9PEZI|nr:hypothetical protein F5X68DRAFT_273725 [Plectosphaerella plurivora]
MDVIEGQQTRPGAASRRQALNACDACRRRKTKCDEDRPSCGRCGRLGLECSYVDTVAYKKNLSVAALADTLKRMDERLEHLTELVEKGQQQPQQPEVCLQQDAIPHVAATPATYTLPRHPGLTPRATLADEIFGASPRFLDTGRVREELSLTQKHCVAPQHLLTWTCSPLTLTESQLLYPMELETKRPSLSRFTAPPRGLMQYISDPGWVSHLALNHIDFLAGYYFAHYHPSCLVLSETTFYNHHLNRTLRGTLPDDVDTCIVLLVCALGSIAAYHDGHEEWGQAEELDVGLGLFNAAREKFFNVETADWPSVQCLLLMGMFYSAKLRIYDAWHVTHRACSTILILAPLQTMLAAHQCQLFWIAYLQESQLLAEFDLPPSGLGKLANSIPLPLVPNAATDPRLAQYQFFFLALIAIRKLLNRVLLYLYSRDQSDDSHSVSSPSADTPAIFLSASHSMIAELDRQLEEWRACLPSSLHFDQYSPSEERAPPGPHQPRPTEERLRGFLKARYFAAKSIIYRPFIYRALHATHAMLLSDEEKAGARAAVGAAFMNAVSSGLLHEPLTLLFHPINVWRSFFALAIQVSLVSNSEAAAFALPNDWRLVETMRQRGATVGSLMSPTVARDDEILRILS